MRLLQGLDSETFWLTAQWYEDNPNRGSRYVREALSAMIEATPWIRSNAGFAWAQENKCQTTRCASKRSKGCGNYCRDCDTKRKFSSRPRVEELECPAGLGLSGWEAMEEIHEQFDFLGDWQCGLPVTRLFIVNQYGPRKEHRNGQPR